MAGSAATVACDEAIEKGKALAGLVLEAATADIEFAEGAFTVAGTDRSIGIRALTQNVAAQTDIPEELAGGMDTIAEFVSPQMSFPNGCHVCEVEIDPDTGIVEIVGYAVERPFGLGSVVGPIVAASETDAIALFNASVRPGFVRVDRPMEAALFGQHLTNCGLAGDEVSDVMVLGEWPALSGPAHVFAMAGHAWG